MDFRSDRIDQPLNLLGSHISQERRSLDFLSTTPQHHTQEVQENGYYLHRYQNL